MNEIRDRLMQAARHAGVGESQARIADSLGLERATVNRWVLGAREPSAAMLVHVASTWGVSVEWLQTGKGDMLPNPDDLPADEQELLRDYRKASAPARENIRSVARALRKSIVTVAAILPGFMAPKDSSAFDITQVAVTDAPAVIETIRERITHCISKLISAMRYARSRFAIACQDSGNKFASA